MGFEVEVVTPAGVVASGSYDEVALPAWDGENGLLAEHQDYIGMLGTGPLKLVKEKEDHWLVVSGGVYKVEGGKLTVLPQVAETPDEINITENNARFDELQKKMMKAGATTKSFTSMRQEMELCRARTTVYKREREVN